MKRLIDLDQLDLSGKPTVAKYLDRWIEQHPIDAITIGEHDGWEIILKKTAETATSET